MAAASAMAAEAAVEATGEGRVVAMTEPEAEKVAAGTVEVAVRAAVVAAQLIAASLL